ncbi:MAG: carbon-nitrogen hydrolase family protein [Alphaproteobacteria bacterium]
MRIALVQYTGAASLAENIAQARPMLEDAAGAGAEMIFLPEVANLVQRNAEKARREVQAEADDPFLAMVRDVAKSKSVWIQACLAVQPGDADDRLANRALLIGPDGGTAARYDKIHMFDVALSGGETYRESATYRPGDRAVLADTPWGGIGLTICYDMRFPYLYRDLAGKGAVMLTAPSAFTRKTGTAHWHTLLRARAIETGSFVIAAAQTGDHPDGRRTYGHSLVVDPWGGIVAELGTEPGILTADLDLALVGRVRSMIPSLDNGRSYGF